MSSHILQDILDYCFTLHPPLPKCSYPQSSPKILNNYSTLPHFSLTCSYPRPPLVYLTTVLLSTPLLPKCLYPQTSLTILDNCYTLPHPSPTCSHPSPSLAYLITVLLPTSPLPKRSYPQCSLETLDNCSTIPHPHPVQLTFAIRAVPNPP